MTKAEKQTLKTAISELEKIGKETTGTKWEYVIEIPMKLPSLNDYIRACRGNKYGANNIKKTLESEIAYYLAPLPRFEKPVKIHFLWIEETKRRDYDNIAFAKKFILDALQKSGKLKNDNRKWVKGFMDDFEYGEQGVIITIREVTR